jgi:predicted deacetylase
MRYLLSIHDVWPGNFTLVEEYWSRLRSMGMGPAALLVVPEYHGQRPIAGEKEFLAWLTEKKAAGSEIFLHGFRHRMAERVPGAPLPGTRSAWGRWMNGRVNQEAEFCGLSSGACETLLAAGAEAFGRAGLAPTGFVAPTWHGAPPARSLKGRGFALWETRVLLHHLTLGKTRFAPPLAWENGSGGPRLFGGQIWLRAALRLPLIKVAIHPGDFTAGDAEEVLRKVASTGKASAYASVFQ